MSIDQLLSFCAFAAIASVTPGPNNTMVLASGLNHGFVRSLPHLAGVSLGFGFMVFGTGLGLHAVFVEFPALQTVLKYAGALYLLWLAWQLARSGPMDADQRQATRPMTFLAAAGFQWINPKAWVMAVGAMTTYLPPDSRPLDVAILATLFGLVCAPCIIVWAVFGVAMRRVLQNPRSVRVFNMVAAALLVASLYPILFD